MPTSRHREYYWCFAAFAACFLLLGSGASGAGVTLCFEAEHANELTFPFEIDKHDASSGGLALGLPEGGGDSSSFRGDQGTATFRVRIPEPGNYTLWVRVWWNGFCSNTLSVSVLGRRRSVSSRTLGRWHWRSVAAWPLNAGVTVIRLHNQQDGIWVDQLVLTSEGFHPPKGQPCTADTIPGNPKTERPEPAMFLAAASDGSAPLPPTDFAMGHKGGRRERMDRIGRCVLRSTSPTTVVVWLRNNSLAEVTGKVTLSTPAQIKAAPGIEQTFRIPRGVPLHKVTFKLSPTPNMPRKVYPMFVRLHHKGGKIDEKKVWLVRPFQWLATKAIPTRGMGLKQTSAIEAKLDRGFPGPAPGIPWHLVKDSAVTAFGLIDMRQAVADRTYVMAYVYTRVTSAKDADVLLDVRHDDMICVWLNGAQVFAAARSAPSVQSRRLVRVRLKAGDNHLLVKLCQVKNYWEFTTSFVTLDRRPAPVVGCDVSSLLKRPEAP